MGLPTLQCTCGGLTIHTAFLPLRGGVANSHHQGCCEKHIYEELAPGFCKWEHLLGAG